MPRLSDVFANPEPQSSDSSSDGNVSNDIVGDLTSTIGLDASNESESWSRDEDGNESYESSDTALGLDTSTDGLLGSVTDAMGSSDQSTTD
jgi:hypothetical protein